MERTLVIGDIHGGLRALKQLFEMAAVTPLDKLIFLGDYVDSWSESPQTLDFLIDIRKTHNCTFIRGNHDELLLQWLLGTDNKMWHQHGGLATMISYENLGNDVRQKHITFLESLDNYHLDESNRLFVHAGFTNMHGVTHEHYPRLLFWDRTLWETAVGLDKDLNPDDVNYPKRFRNYHEIYIGHTPVTKIGETVPTQRANVWNVDTGAGFAGTISMLDVDSKEFWQSDPLPELYPGEAGRNALL
ncbi:MAG: serine/threonine protein phosphatase [Flavobacterium sp.]|nr:MAG: serine/threonine protein phosphatase [Flavobacterium sp.]